MGKPGDNLDVVNYIFVLVIFIALFSVIIWLQVHLSKKENKWVGLFLPIFSLYLSLVISLGRMGYQFNTTTKMQTID